MVKLSRKVDYALVCLAHLLENPDQLVSARGISQRHGLPGSLVMQILKQLHRGGVLNSSRGVKGGYRIAISLDDLSLGQLIELIDGNNGATHSRLSMLPPVQGLQYRLIAVLRDLKVTDLVKPGRRIDVPVESVRFHERKSPSAQAVA